MFFRAKFQSWTHFGTARAVCPMDCAPKNIFSLYLFNLNQDENYKSAIKHVLESYDTSNM